MKLGRDGLVAAADSTEATGPSGGTRWLLIFWMFVISGVAYLDRVNIAVAGHSIAGEFGLDNIRLGWVFSSFLFGYALFQAPGGRLADRYGPRLVLTLGTIWWAVFTSLTAFVHAGMLQSLAMLIGVRFALGVGEAVVYPASNRLVAGWIPTQERGLATGVIFAGVGVGAGATPPLITYILLHHGWRWSFWISALIGLVAGAGWYLLARDRPEEHAWVGPGELAHIQRGSPVTIAQRPLAWGVIFRSKDVRAISLSYFCYGYVAYIFFSWFFIYLSYVRGLDLRSSSYYAMLPFIAMAITSPLGGLVGDRLVPRLGNRVARCGIAGGSMALAGIFLALGPVTKDARLASIVLAGGAGALYFSLSSFWAVTSEIAGHSAGSVSGVMNMANQIAGMVTASLTPLLAKHYGWGVPFFVAAAMSVVGAVAWLAVDPEARLEEGSRG